MAMFSWSLGLLGGKGTPKPQQRRGPLGNPIVAPGPTTAAQQVAATNPPNVLKAESANIATARGQAARTRRKAKSGSAGRVRPRGVPVGARTGLSGGGGYGTPRSLIGS